MASESVDELLARYLGLLHEYTELRSQLANHQARLYGSLARANFAAERGFRYGPDHYDGRMQALARLVVSGGGASGEDTAFTVVRTRTQMEGNNNDDDNGADKSGKEDKKAEDGDDDGAPEIGSADAPPQAATKKAGAAKGPRDPLQWFGVLAPMALRQAQREAVTAVDSIIPQLASLSAAMAAVEIAVRRARKKRARAAAASDKAKKDTDKQEAETRRAVAAAASV